MADLTYIKISRLHPHPDNPRKELGDLSELSASIKENGVYQNLTVIPGHYMDREEYATAAAAEGAEKNIARSMWTPKICWSSEDYTIIIGHRRAAAARSAGLAELPCVVVEMTEQEQLQTMMVENMQRSDLTVYEQAQGFQLMLDMGDTVQGVSEKSGFSQSTIRRRIKLLELNHENFRKAERRGATLADFDELNKIEDLDARNTVLETIGTSNFNRAMQQALSDQKFQHRKAEWVEQLRKFAVENPDASYQSHTHVAGYGYWNTKADIDVPEDADTTAYCYKVSEKQIDLYKDRDLEKENEENAKKEEKRQMEKFCREQLSSLSNYMFELRRDFVQQVSTIECRKRLGEIIRFAANKLDAARCNNELVTKLLGIVSPETDCVDLVEYLEKCAAFSAQPEKTLLVLAYLTAESSVNGYWGWTKNAETGKFGYGWVKNEDLDAIYELLIALGYEMSDEEKQLQNGTHPVFNSGRLDSIGSNRE